MKIQNEYDCLIYLIKCAIHSAEPESIPENIAFEKVLALGIENEVANFAFEAVKKMKKPFSPDVMKLWEQEYWKGVKRDITQSKIREEVLGILHSNGIYTLELQGTVVKKYYPESHLRMMSDIDLIIPKEKLNEAEEVMRSIGYEVSRSDESETVAFKNQFCVELHTDFFSEESTVNNSLKEPFSYATLNDDFNAYVSDTVFYLFHLLHTIKHSLNRGAGIRRIIDLYYLENAMKGKVDREYIDNALKEYGFYEQKEKLLKVKEHWFGDESDSEYGDISDFEEEVKISGKHGTKSLHYKHKFEREKKSGKHFVKLRYLLSFVFPSKEAIYEDYPFCKKHRYPLLLCFIHRFNCIVFNRKKWKNVRRIFDRLKN